MTGGVGFYAARATARGRTEELEHKLRTTRREESLAAFATHMECDYEFQTCIRGKHLTHEWWVEYLRDRLGPSMARLGLIASSEVDTAASELFRLYSEAVHAGTKGEPAATDEARKAAAEAAYAAFREQDEPIGEARVGLVDAMRDQLA